VRLGWPSAADPALPVARQCLLAGVPRSTWYASLDPAPPDPAEVALRHAVDEIYTALPFYGAPRITAELRRRGWPVNHKRVERAMREMGIRGISPRKSGSAPHPNHPVFPYLLRGVGVLRPDHVWGTDITYVRADGRWLYLVALMGWFSRYVLAWRVSDLMTAAVCREALEEALSRSAPEIHNSDQGSQFTSDEYVGALLSRGVAVSMDGRGRCFDNIFTERLWRTVKYEEVYLNSYGSLAEARDSLGRYFALYNGVRLHSSLNYRTPAEAYFGGRD
jgi:putative transposase